MALINEGTKQKLFVLFIISGCVGAALLLGMVLFEMHWGARDRDIVKSKNETLELNEAVEYLREKWEENLTSLEKAEELLKLFPVIDGHNDFPWNLRKFIQNDLRKFDFEDLTVVEPWASYNESYTDLRRLRKGHVGAQFWVSYTDCQSQAKDAVIHFLEQIDVIQRLVDAYPVDLKFCDTSSCILDSRREGKIASLIGVEGGHSVASSPGILRQLYRLGARYMTLTHTCSTPWADASPVDVKGAGPNGGLSNFGMRLIDEMNRIGMMVDLSHVSQATMKDAIERSKAPVIFSHSGVKAICDHHRNVGDDVLRQMTTKDGIIMINFYSNFIQCDSTKNATIDDVVAHIQHVRKLIGVDYIGIGGDFDGVDSVPRGLDDVSKYPNLFAKLIDLGWEIDDLKKVSFENFVRVMRQVEKVAESMKDDVPMQSIIPMDELKSKVPSYENCSSHKALGILVEKTSYQGSQ